MVLVESAIFFYGAYKFDKRRREKKAREAGALKTAPDSVYAYYRSSPQPLFSIAAAPTPTEHQASTTRHAENVTRPPLQPKLRAAGQEVEWRPVYMLERSNSNHACLSSES